MIRLLSYIVIFILLYAFMLIGTTVDEVIRKQSHEHTSFERMMMLVQAFIITSLVVRG